MTNYGKIFADELTNWLINETGFKQSKFVMSVYYNYETDEYKLVVLYYVDDCVYLYTYEELGKCFVDKPGNIFHINFLGYTHWFISIRI